MFRLKRGVPGHCDSPKQVQVKFEEVGSLSLGDSEGEGYPTCEKKYGIVLNFL